MRVFFCSDLHVDVGENARFVADLAALARAERPDVLVVAGDVCNGPSGLPSVLRAFAPAAPRRIYVPGNHELWLSGDGASARHLYYRELPKLAADVGFECLAVEAITVDDVAFVGGMAWYDYSFAPAARDWTDEEQRSKSRSGMVWQDARFVRWRDEAGAPLSDPDVVALLAEDLDAQLEAVSDAPVRRVALVTHHLAFEALVPPLFDRPERRFFRAYLGARRFGEAAARDPRLDFAFAGHVHSKRDCVVGRIRAVTCPTAYPRERAPAETPEDRRLLVDL